jgi:hypothetical protein
MTTVAVIALERRQFSMLLAANGSGHRKNLRRSGLLSSLTTRNPGRILSLFHNPTIPACVAHPPNATSGILAHCESNTFSTYLNSK